MVELGWEPRLGKPLQNLHRDMTQKKHILLSLTFLYSVLINDYSIKCLWLTVRQHGMAWFPFLGPWRPLKTMDKKVPKILDFIDKWGPKSQALLAPVRSRPARSTVVWKLFTNFDFATEALTHHPWDIHHPHLNCHESIFLNSFVYSCCSSLSSSWKCKSCK